MKKDKIHLNNTCLRLNNTCLRVAAIKMQRQLTNEKLNNLDDYFNIDKQAQEKFDGISQCECTVNGVPMYPFIGGEASRGDGIPFNS